MYTMRMSLKDKRTEQKFLLSERMALLEDAERANEDLLRLVNSLHGVKKDIIQVTENTQNGIGPAGAEYLHEVETKNRVSYKKDILRDATRELRRREELLNDLKFPKQNEVKLLLSKARVLEESARLLED